MYCTIRVHRAVRLRSTEYSYSSRESGGYGVTYRKSCVVQCIAYVACKLYSTMSYDVTYRHPPPPSPHRMCVHVYKCMCVCVNVYVAYVNVKKLIYVQVKNPKSISARKLSKSSKPTYPRPNRPPVSAYAHIN